MTIEFIIQLEDAIDKLDHTRSCLVNNLAQGRPCRCKLQMIRDAVAEYRKAVWEEHKED